MKKVCLQVGHQNIEQITSEGLRSWRSADVLKRSTGASGERDWHWNEWMPRLRDKLIQAGVQVYIIDAKYSSETYNQEYDLWISGHYDGGGTGKRCMVSAPNRDTVPAYLNEAAQREAERFCAIWKSTYPDLVGVPNKDEFITPGMKDYYAFDYVGLDTPSVIVEHFNHTSPMGGQLKSDPDKVVEGDFKAIMEYLQLANGDDTCTVELSDCRDKLKTANELLGNKSEEMARLTKDYNETLDKLKKQEADNTDLLQQLTESRNEIGSLKLELKSATNSLEKCQIENGKYLKGTRVLEEENKGLKQELTSCTSLKLADFSGFELVKELINRVFGKGSKK